MHTKYRARGEIWKVKQEVYLLRDQWSILNSTGSSAGLKYPETTQIVHLGTIVEEPKCGKIELGACLGSPDCSGPDTLILFSSVWGSTWAYTPQVASTAKH